MNNCERIGEVQCFSQVISGTKAETNLISLMYINLNSVHSNANDLLRAGIQHNFVTYILQQPITNAFKIICTI